MCGCQKSVIKYKENERKRTKVIIKLKARELVFRFRKRDLLRTFCVGLMKHRTKATLQVHCTLTKHTTIIRSHRQFTQSGISHRPVIRSHRQLTQSSISHTPVSYQVTSTTHSLSRVSHNVHTQSHADSSCCTSILHNCGNVVTWISTCNSTW